MDEDNHSQEESEERVEKGLRPEAQGAPTYTEEGH